MSEKEETIDFLSRKDYYVFEKLYNLKNAFVKATCENRLTTKNEDFLFFGFYSVIFLTMTNYYVIDIIFSGWFFSSILFVIISLSILSFCLLSTIAIATAFKLRLNQLSRYCCLEPKEQTFHDYEKELKHLPLSLSRFMPYPNNVFLILTILCTFASPAWSLANDCGNVIIYPSFSLSLFTIIFNLLFLAYKYHKYNNLFKTNHNENN